MNKKYLLYGLVAIVLAAAMVGYGMYNKPHADLGELTADHQLTATELFTAYETSEATANEQYLDKIIRVTGEIQSVSTDDKGQTSLTLDAGGIMGGVICQLAPDLTATNLSAGQQVTLNGRCTGMLMDVVLVRCVPVS